MNSLKLAKRWVLLATVFSFLAACAGVETFPNYARSGETVSLALGGTISANQGPLNTTGATVNVVDQNSVAYPVTFRHALRLLPDPTSNFYAANAPGASLRANADAQLIAVVDLIDPVSGNPPSIPAGPATVEFNFPNGEIFVPGLPNGSYVNTVSAQIQILDDANSPGTPNPFEYYWPFGTAADQVGSLEPMHQIFISANDLTPTVDEGYGDGLAAVEYVVEYTAADFSSSENNKPQVIYVGQESNVQAFTRYEDLGNGDIRITTRLMNPYGFAGIGALGGGFPNCVIVWASANQTITNNNWSTYFRNISATFFDINGDEMVAAYDAAVTPHIQ